MSARRFDGAITTPEESGEVRDASVAPEPERPPRPALIELAAAILIVGGMTAVLQRVGSSAGGASGGIVDVLLLGLSLLTVVVGVLVRMGRGWVLAVNVVAIALFLEVTALPSIFAITFGLFDAVVLFALFRHRAWFLWQREARP